MACNVLHADFGRNTPTHQIPEPERREAKVADLDDGYVRIANSLYEALIAADLTRNQAKVAHAVVRLTYGFSKRTDRLSDSQLGDLTNLSRQKVNKAKNELISMGVICVEGRAIGPNKSISDWRTECHQNSDTVTKTRTPKKCHQNGDTVTETVTKNVTKTVTHQIHKDRPEKANTPYIPPTGESPTEQITTLLQGDALPAERVPVPDQPAKPKRTRSAEVTVDYSCWPGLPTAQVLSDWQAQRKRKRAPISQTVVNSFGKELTRAAAHGLSVDDCLIECLNRGWVGFKAEWVLRNLQAQHRPAQPRRATLEDNMDTSWIYGIEEML